ncbi:unnamed protein product [Brassica rapa subsp. trilocularis]
MRLCFPLQALIIITPSDVYLDCYSGESSDETSFSPAALFISSTRSLGGVQFGDPNPSNITIWAWPIKGYKKVSPLLRSLSVSKPTFVWGSLVIWSNLLIFSVGSLKILPKLLICIQRLISLIRRVFEVSIYRWIHRDNLHHFHHYHPSLRRCEPYYPMPQL